MRLGIASDHGGFELKKKILARLKLAGHAVQDFGAKELKEDDDYPDYVIPLARAVSCREIDRGIAICGSGVGASIACNKVDGARAALITDIFSAHQGVEDDNMNIICFGGRVTGEAVVWELVNSFINARFKGEERYQRRLSKVLALERKGETKNE